VSPREISALVSEHAAFVWRVLMHLGVPDSQLDDLSQDVFLVVLRQIEGFEERSSLRTWLFGICRNVAAAARRQGHVKNEVLNGELPETIVQPAQEGVVWIKQAHARLIEALGELSEEQRMVFVLFEIEELSMKEIAGAAGATESTCYSRLYAARDSVQAALRRRALREPRLKGRGAG
jgi:RNA polymerase sigma-70 factor (ECF subfamily)